MSNFQIDRDFARRAFYNVSFDPEKRGDLFVDDFDKTLANFREKVFADKVLSDKVKEEIFEKIASKLKTLAEKYLSAESCCISAAIVGPAKFPVKKAEKANNRCGDRLNDYVVQIRWLDINLQKILYKKYPAEDKKVVEDEKQTNLLIQQAYNFVENKKDSENPDVFSYNAFPHLKGAFQTALKHQRFISCRKCIEFLESNLDFVRISRNINILKKMLADAEKNAENAVVKETEEKSFDLFSIKKNYELNRYQIIFDGKPAADIISELKKNGFKWAPSQKAWQRQLTVSSKYAVDRFLTYMENRENEQKVYI